MNVYESIEDCIKEGKVEEIELIIKSAINTKYPPHMILEKGLISGINSITYELEYGKITIPEVLISSMAVQVGMDILKPYLDKDKKNEVVAMIGTVEGDMHDIGKDIVKMLVESTGIRVIDLGVDVSTDRFVDAVRREKPDLLFISALLTTTMYEIDKVIKGLVKASLRDDLKVFIGGKPVDENFSKMVGADYYFEQAIDLRKFISQNLYNFKK